jgi:N-acetylmuramoyl-L-alanine amidase
LSSIRRCAARIGSAAAALALVAGICCAARAAGNASELRIVNAAFVSVNDASLRGVLRAIGATLTWRRGRRDVIVATASHELVTFTVGDRRYEAAGVSAQAPFAPYLKAGVPFLPTASLLSALALGSAPQGRTLVLEPEISSLDVRSGGAGTTIVAVAAMPLRPRVVRQAPRQVTYAFDGVGTTVSGTRPVGGGGVRDVVVRSVGRVPSTRTFITLDLLAGARLGAPRSDDGRDFSVSVAGSARPTVHATTPAPQQSGTQVTAVDVIPAAGSFTVAIAVAGDARYAWHHLPPPDNRFWIDVQGARLDAPPRDDRWIGHVTGVRVQQDTPDTVRVALSLADPAALAVVPSATGVRVVIGSALALDAPRAGSGSIGSLVAASVQAPPSTPAPVATALLTPAPYHPQYVATNPRLIVIDPGHGGNDPGVVRGSVQEKTLTLDMAQRLRAVLIARGWQVRMTRTTDVAVDGPAASDRDELQARDDVANDNGARMFVSIHVNAYAPDPGPNGTTSFYSKPEDVPLARDVENAIAAGAGTRNDGIVKSKLYVTLHARMPAVLVETAFITNASDFAKLVSPAWRERVAESIADGIETYARENPVATPPPGQ